MDMIYMNIVDHKFCSVMNESEMYLMVYENYSLEKDFVFVARKRVVFCPWEKKNDD